MLNAHPRIHCGPEVPFFRDFYADYRDDPLRHLRLTQAARSLLPEDDLLLVLGRAFVTVHEQAAERAGKARWADKAPENVLYTAQWDRLLGDRWLFIHVVRNPLDTLASMEEARFPLTLPQKLEDRIMFYRRYTEAGLRFGDEQPARYRLVIYDALCRSPVTVLGELMEWAGEGVDPRQFTFNVVPHYTGLEDSKVGETTSVHTASLGRWPAAFSASTAEAAWTATKDLWSQIDPEEQYVPTGPVPPRPSERTEDRS